MMKLGVYIAIAATVWLFSIVTPSAAPRHPKWRYIGKERVPWEHDVDAHEWEEFEHSVDECIPPQETK